MDEDEDTLEGEKTAFIENIPTKKMGEKEPTLHPVLIVMTGPTKGQTINLEKQDRWTLGRSADNDVTFYDNSVSRRHCEIVHDQAGNWILKDLNSSNGCFIGGTKVNKSQQLKADDQIHMSSQAIVKFVLQDQAGVAVQKELYESAKRDALTGIASKQFFLDRLGEEFFHHKRTKKPLSVIVADVDFFKKVNDTYGHLAGDYVLKEIGAVLNSIVRRGDMVARYGGEEIVFFLRETTPKGATIFAERARQLIEEHKFEFEGNKIPVTVSLGLSTYQDGNFQEPVEMIKSADKCLYEAKEGGRNKVVSAS